MNGSIWVIYNKKTGSEYSQMGEFETSEDARAELQRRTADFDVNMKELLGVRERPKGR